MQPQNHIYRFINENILVILVILVILLGQLDVPEYNSVKYGRNSLKLASILLWNNLLRNSIPTQAFFPSPGEVLKSNS